MKRNLYQDLLLWKQKKDRKPLMLYGARQVGKTFLLEEFGKQEFPRTHRINFEKTPKACSIFEPDLNPKRILSDLALLLNEKISIKEDLVIFDEIQMCPKAITSLKYFCEDLPELALCSAGSLLGVHFAPASYPVGKVDVMHLFPMSFEEFLKALGEGGFVDRISKLDLDTGLPEAIHEKLFYLLKVYFVVGGLPEVVKTFSEIKEDVVGAFQEVRNKQRALIATYLADMAKHSGKTNAMHIQRVWSSIPLQLARSLDGESSKFVFKGVIPNVNRYQQLVGALDWLQAAGLVLKVSIVEAPVIPLKAYTKENTFKLMLFDVGLLGALSDLRPEEIMQYEYGSYKGYFAENFVAQEFAAQYQEPLFSWHRASSEVEFLRNIGGEVVPFEVKSGSATRSKSLASFHERYKPEVMVILSGRSLEPNRGRKKQHYPLYLAARTPFKDLPCL